MPVVVLVLATRVPAAPEVGDQAEVGAMDVLHGALQIDGRPSVQRRATRIDLYRTVARELTRPFREDHDPL